MPERNLVRDNNRAVPQVNERCSEDFARRLVGHALIEGFWNDGDGLLVSTLREIHRDGM